MNLCEYLAAAMASDWHIVISNIFDAFILISVIISTLLNHRANKASSGASRDTIDRLEAHIAELERLRNAYESFRKYFGDHSGSTRR